mgnify:CR=1 FL=1
MFLFAVVTFEHTILLIGYVKQCGHGFIVGNAFGVGTLHDAFQIIGHAHLFLFNNLVITNNVQFHVRSHDRNSVNLFVAEKLIGYFDDALCAQLLAFEVETDGDVILHVFQSQ